MRSGQAPARARRADGDARPMVPPETPGVATPDPLVEAYAARVRRLLRGRWQAIAAFALLLATVEAIRAWAGSRNDPGASVAALFGWLLVEVPALGAGAVLGPVLAEAAGWRGWRGILLTVALTFAGVGLGLAAIFVLAGDLLAAQVAAGAIVSVEAFALSILWIFAMAGLLFAAYTRVHEREVAITRAAQAAGLDRAGAERALMESRLRVMQARIEPEFLFGALERVHALYGSAPASAGQMLDELIAYLRAALPRMRGEVSTIGGELDLVRSYLAVLRMPNGDRLGVDVRSDPAASARRFPPMVLLPLVQGAVADGTASRRRIGIESEVDANAARIVVTVEGGPRPAGWFDDAMSGIREPLEITCGKGCVLAIASEGERHGVTITVPLPASLPGPL
jgi:hypothetical protein